MCIWRGIDLGSDLRRVNLGNYTCNTKDAIMMLLGDYNTKSNAFFIYMSTRRSQKHQFHLLATILSDRYCDILVHCTRHFFLEECFVQCNRNVTVVTILYFGNTVQKVQLSSQCEQLLSMNTSP